MNWFGHLAILLSMASSLQAQTVKFTNSNTTTNNDCSKLTYGEAPFLYIGMDKSKHQVNVCCTHDSVYNFNDQTSDYRTIIKDEKGRVKLKKLKDVSCCFPFGSECTKGKIPCCESSTCSKKKKNDPIYRCGQITKLFKLKLIPSESKSCLDKKRPHYAQVQISITNKDFNETYNGVACCASKQINVVPFKKNCCATSNTPVVKTHMGCCGAKPQLENGLSDYHLYYPDFPSFKVETHVPYGLLHMGFNICPKGLAGLYNVTSNLDEKRGDFGPPYLDEKTNQPQPCKYDGGKTRQFKLGCCPRVESIYESFKKQKSECCLIQTDECKDGIPCCNQQCLKSYTDGSYSCEKS